MAATIIDVARRAGLSTATVSRALRGLPNVSEDAKSRVLRAAEELSYTVSPLASHLSSGRTGAVGVVAPFLNRWFFGQVVVGIDSELRSHDMDLLLYNLGDARVHERFFERMPVRRRVDALIVLNLPLSPAETEALGALEMPVAVLGDRDPTPAFWNVRIDDHAASAAAVRHLVNLGHRRIGMITGTTPDARVFHTPIVRRQAYRTTLAEAGIAHDPRLEAPAHFGVEGGASAMAQLLALPDPPTAVFAESDELAFGALRTVRRMGLSCPRDVSLFGFDDHEMASLMDLTTIAQPVVEQGALLARQVLEALACECEEPSEVVLPSRMVVRGTTGPAGRPALALPPEPGPERGPEPEPAPPRFPHS